MTSTTQSIVLALSLLVGLILTIDVVVQFATVKFSSDISHERYKSAQWYTFCRYASLLDPHTNHVYIIDNIATNTATDDMAPLEDEELRVLCMQRTAWISYDGSSVGILLVVFGRTQIGYWFLIMTGVDPLIGSGLSWRTYWKHQGYETQLQSHVTEAAARFLYVLADELIRMHFLIQLSIFAFLVFTIYRMMIQSARFARVESRQHEQKIIYQSKHL